MLGPLTCFLFTAIYAVGLRIGYVVANAQDEPRRSIMHAALFSLSLVIMAVGMQMLTRWIVQSNGYYG